MVNEIIGAVLQIIAFSLIPFLVYAIQKRTIAGFLDYIGLKRSTFQANLLAVIASLIFVTPPLILAALNPEFRAIMTDPNSVTGKFRAMGPTATSIVILLVMAIFKTGLAEEIFFRGFIAKRLIHWLGFLRGNIVQAIIFGALHVAIFAVVNAEIFSLLFIFAFTSLGAYVSAFLNEKRANGSIIPGWIMHGLGNVMAYSVVGFLI